MLYCIYTAKPKLQLPSAKLLLSTYSSNTAYTIITIHECNDATHSVVSVCVSVCNALLFKALI